MGRPLFAGGPEAWVLCVTGGLGKDTIGQRCGGETAPFPADGEREAGLCRRGFA